MNTYDPNVSWAKHTVEITFQEWDYLLSVQVTINGNCRGLHILKTAVGLYADQLYKEQGEFPTIYLSKNNGEKTLEITLGESENEMEDDLESLCVGLKIVGHEKESAL